LDLCRRDYFAINDTDAVLLRTKLSRRGQSANDGSGIVLNGVLLGRTEECGPEKKSYSTDENHFHPV